jgi:hypothetical protein
MRLLRAHKVFVETRLGSGPRGDTYAAPVEVRCFLDRGEVVTTTANTEVTEHASRIYARPKYAATLTPESRVTLPDGSKARISKAVQRDGGALLGAVAHVEVHLA